MGFFGIIIPTLLICQTILATPPFEDSRLYPDKVILHYMGKGWIHR